MKLLALLALTFALCSCGSATGNRCEREWYYATHRLIGNDI
jgi:hypothetical protein